MSNEVEKILNYILYWSCFYKITLEGVQWEEGVEMDWIPSLFLSRENVIVFYNVKLA